LLASRRGDPREVLLSEEKEPRETTINGARPACGFYWTEGNRGLGWAVDAVPTLKGGSSIGIPSPPAIWMPDGRIVTPSIEDAERLQGLEEGWTKPAEEVEKGRRSARWRLVGNAVTVSVAEWIGLRLRVPLPYREDDELLDQGSPWPTAAWNLEMSPNSRRRSNVSKWPVRRHPKRLDLFVKDPAPLSVKAAEGFLQRLDRSSLRCGDHREELLRDLRKHVRNMTKSDRGQRKRVSVEC